MTNSTHTPWWHWVVLFSGLPLAGVALSFLFLTQQLEHPFITAAIVTGIGAALVDFARRNDVSAAISGAVAGALVIPFAYGVFFTFLVIACSTSGCDFS